MSTPAAKPARGPLLAAIACAAVGGGLFQWFGNAAKGYVQSDSLFWWWISQWLDPRAETEHGWLILGLSGWLLWRNLRISDSRWPIVDLQARQSATDNWQSATAMVGGLALHALGFMAQQARISILACLLFTWGVLRLGGGRRWGAAAMFPLGFLVFAIPINVLDSIGFWLRVWVVDASSLIVRAVGIGVLQSGTQLLAPDGSYNYDVAAACSGIRSLTAMAALSLLAGYLNFGSVWRRALVLGLCFPLVYVGNVARIVAIIFAAQAGGPRWGDIAHEVMGYGVFAIVLGGVLGAASLLRRWLPEAAPAAEVPGRTLGSDTPPDVRHLLGDKPSSTVLPPPADSCNLLGDTTRPPASISSLELCHLIGDTTDSRVAVPTAGYCHLIGDTRVAWGVAGMVVLLAVGEMAWLRQLARATGRGEAGVTLSADQRNPVELPAFLGTEWIGRRTEVSAVEREVLPPDTGYSRKQYVALADARRQVFLSIVLSGRDRTSIHRPELCLVGQGWTIVEAGAHRFQYPGRPDAAFAATLLRVQRELQAPQGRLVVPQLVAYWFIGSDAVVGTHWVMFLRDASNRVLRGRADRWAYVLMQTDAADGEAAALQRMQAVLDETLPVFAPRRM